MLLLNWLELNLSSKDWNETILGLKAPVHIRSLLMKLVVSLLRSGNWEERREAIPLFEPFHLYQAGDTFALPVFDSQGVRPAYWQIANIQKVENVQNPRQGSFQILYLDVEGRKDQRAAGISVAPPIHFTLPESPTDQEILAAEIVERYFSLLKEKLLKAIKTGSFHGQILDDTVLAGTPDALSKEARELIKGLFDQLDERIIFLTSDTILDDLKSKGWLTDYDHETAIFTLNLCLKDMGYHDLQENQWVTSEQFDSMQRPIRRYIDVPRIRSRATILDDDLDTVPLTEEFAQQASDLAEEVFTVVEASSGEWRPSADLVDLGYLKFLHLMEGYLPLSRQVSREFPPGREIQLVEIEIINGVPIKFLVRRDMGILQAIDKEAFRVKLTQELNMWAGTRLWIRYQSPNHYRIAPKFLATPRKIKAKMLNWDRQLSRLEIELFDLEMQYEGDEHLYKSELRLTDLEALWAEAEERGLSILDCVKEVFPQLARLDPRGRVYYKDLYNAVFFGYRMCSPHTIPALLHQFECFLKAEDGYYTFDPTKGNHQRVVNRRTQVRILPQRTGVAGDDGSDIWNHISGMVGKKFFTLGQKWEFELIAIGDRKLQIRTSTGNLRNINRDRIEEAWRELKGTGSLSRIEVRDQYSEMNSAYIIALISSLPGVNIASTHPIRLSRGIDSIPVEEPSYEKDKRADATPPREEPLIDNIWFDFLNDKEIQSRVSEWVEAYLNEPLSIDKPYPGIDREITLFLREQAHQRIHGLLTKEYVSIMSEKDFNDAIFQFGTIRNGQGNEINLKKLPYLFIDHWKELIKRKIKNADTPVTASDITNYLREIGITTTGNQTWGSASRIWAPQIKADKETRQKILHKSLLLLITRGWPVHLRIEQVMEIPNGFGMNLSSGIFHILYPNSCVLYNDRSVQALKKMGFLWYEKWQNHAAYSEYNEFCKNLLEQFGFRSMTDVDYFIYNVSIGTFDREQPEKPVTSVTIQKAEKPAQSVVSSEMADDSEAHVPTDGNSVPPITEDPIYELGNLQSDTHSQPESDSSDSHLPKPGHVEEKGLESNPTSVIEHTRKGQFVMPGVIPAGPLFDQPPTSGLSPIPDKKIPLKTSKQISSQRRLPMDQLQLKTLFSRHYLDSRLPQQPEWLEDPTPVFEQLRNLWCKAVENGDNWNEAQTEQEFIKPVLEALGWSYIVQAKATKGGKRTRPDYALFADDATKTSAYGLQGSDDAFYGRSLAIAEAKHWGRALSQKDTSGRSTWKAESNPSLQMVSYLVGTHCAWGILTNGNLWRLYSREVSSTASEYYEIDIADIFDFLSESGVPSIVQIEQFKRWWLFFRRDAFIPDGSGKTFLQRVHEGSTTYAREVSDKLKELVFDEVMPEIASGFLAHRREQLEIQDETPASLAEIYRASLSLLYKLLFLLYAEARSLLPMDNPDYLPHSLTTIAAWAATQIDQQRKLSQATAAAPRYESLLALFWRVNDGDPALGIPHYNGGLFSPLTAENHFLKNHKLSDRSVARVVDLLVRDQGEPVDYAYISVRNLGAIYEGLLENKLTLVSAPLGVKAILVNDKGERKATGSYYTPDKVVEYIVKNTLEPVLESRKVDYEKAMGQATTLRQKLENTVDPATNRLLQGQLDRAERQAREAFLGIKVLDPAMGSGHFLVNAVDHLTDGIIVRMQTYHNTHPEARMEWDPIQQLIDRIRAQILEEMAAQGLTLDARRLDDTALLTRLVMKRCIYGVDLNQMAVELAKLSLWLHTFTVGAPLSFLDHHLRWGNSLIGTDVRTVEREIAAKKVEHPISKTAKNHARARQETARVVAVSVQSSLFAGPFAGLLDLTSVMTEVAERADATLADVRQSVRDYAEFQRLLTPYKHVLDLWVSQYFGNEHALEFLTVFAGDVLPALRGERPVDDKYHRTIDQAHQLYQDKCFFHWDLEFPEVFVDLIGRDWAANGGFDAVIGNPPYVDSETMTKHNPVEREYIAKTYKAAEGNWDLYIPFWQKSFDLTKSGGCSSLITPNKWMAVEYGQSLREYLQTYVSKIGDFSRIKVFEDAGVFPVVVVVTRGDVEYLVIQAYKDNYVLIYEQTITSSFLTTLCETWSILLSDNFPLLQKIIGNGRRLDGIANSEGAFTVSEAYDLSKIVYELSPDHKSFLRLIVTGSIDRYFHSWGIEPTTYLKQRYMCPVVLVDEFKGLFPRRFTQNSNMKIIVAGIRHFEVCFDFNGDLLASKSTVIIRNFSSRERGLFLTAILNSAIMAFFIKQTYGSISMDGGISFTPRLVSSLPIPTIEDLNPPEKISQDLIRVRGLYEENNMKQVFSLVSTWLSSTPRQTDVVHDLLAHLAYQMLDLNKTRLIEVKGFLDWLSREVGAPLNSLSGKTTLVNYLGNYEKNEEVASLQDVLMVLSKNQSKLKVDVSKRDFQEHLVREYQASLDRLLPIKEKLRKTDWLIDQIVYALYGLTESEIAVVEKLLG